MPVVTVRQLAELKGLPERTLREFGLEDRPWGVRFPYVQPSGEPARARRRVGLRGAGGSQWDPDDDRTIAPYWLPAAGGYARRAGYQLVVEGESDCWVAWAHRCPAVGIPGGEHWNTLTAAHLTGVREVFVQVEPDDPRTFRDGVPAYLLAVRDHLRACGFGGSVHRLRHRDGFDDLSDLYLDDPGRFPRRLEAALDRSRRTDGDDAN